MYGIQNQVRKAGEGQTQSGPSGLQRKTESREREEVKAELRQRIKAIREGHATGGYCDTDKLKEAERPLWQLLTEDLEAAKKKHGYSPDPKFKHPEIRVIELELNGLAFKPELVVKA